MAGFELSKYDTVKSRKQKFYNDYEDGRIIVEIVNIETINTHALIKVSLFKNKEDQEKNLIFATGYAHELRETEKQINKWGKEYEGVNYFSWVENCEESAVGRALDNAGYAGSLTCSQEEIKQVESKKNNSSYNPNDSRTQTQKPKVTFLTGEQYKKTLDCQDASKVTAVINKYSTDTMKMPDLFRENLVKHQDQLVKKEMESK